MKLIQSAYKPALLKKKKFLRNYSYRIAFYVLILLSFIAVFSNYIANDQPLYVSYKGKTFYPAFQNSWVGQTIFNSKKVDTIVYEGKKEIIQFDITDWRKMEVENIIWPLVPFSPEKPDYYNRDFVSPSDVQLVPTPSGTTKIASTKLKHLLGTDDLGRDVLAGLIHGTKISLSVGILSMLLAGLIGISIGALSGFYGDDRFKITRIARILFFPIIILGFFFAFISRSATIAEGFETGIISGIFQFTFSIFILVSFSFILLFLLNKIKIGWLGKKIDFPIDSILSRATEVFNSLPKLLLIISLSVIFEQRSIWLVIFIIGLTSWTEIARFMRSELLKIRDLDYITSAKASGINSKKILLKHAIPNAMNPVYVTISFGIASAILIESGLSFLGIGVPEQSVTWGSMLSQGKQELEAWWLILFPGIAIFITVVVFNLIGDGLNEAADVKQSK